MTLPVNADAIAARENAAGRHLPVGFVDAGFICDACTADAVAAQAACTSCGRPVDDLAVFPGGLCLDCYAKTPAATAPLTADGLDALTATWAGRPRRPRGRKS